MWSITLPAIIYSVEGMWWTINLRGHRMVIFSIFDIKKGARKGWLEITPELLKEVDTGLGPEFKTKDVSEFSPSVIIYCGLKTIRCLAFSLIRS